MNPDNRQYIRIKKLTLVVVLLIVLAGVFGWWVGHDSNSDIDTSTPNTQTTGADTNSTNESSSVAEINSLVTYSLPAGWKEYSCPDSNGYIFVGPAGANCGPINLVRISVDTANNTDCNQLQNVENVSKHICISEFINGKKTLKSETIYNAKSSYSANTTVKAYYINTGKGVVKLEYLYNGDNGYQSGFEQLAKSVQTK